MARIDCEKLREQILDECKSRFNNLPSHLQDKIMAIVSVGEDDASKVYIKNKLKTAKKVGVKTLHIKLLESSSFEDVAKTLKDLNESEEVGGIILQLPLPEHLKKEEQLLIDFIHPSKDIDGLTTVSMQRLQTNFLSKTMLVEGRHFYIPATANAVLHLLPEDLSGKNVLLLGRGKLCNRPLMSLLLDKNATVTVAHSKTDYNKLGFYNYNYIISAVGKHGVLNVDNIFDVEDHDMLNIIDVAICRDQNGKLCGDLDLTTDDYWGDEYNVEDFVNFTPVPKGVGVLTTVCLIENFIEALEYQNLTRYNY